MKLALIDIQTEEEIDEAVERLLDELGVDDDDSRDKKGDRPKGPKPS